MRPIKIPCIPPTVSKSIRFPIDLIEQIEKAIQGKQCTFTAFVIEAIRVMLEALEEAENQ